MVRRRFRYTAAAVVTTVLVAAGVVVSQLPAFGAGALLHPLRVRGAGAPPPPFCEEAYFAGDGVRLAGWRCRTTAERRGTIVTLHGFADNRRGALGIIARYLPRGFDVVAYDSRAHGDSDGDVCTYGVRERVDLRRVIDTLDGGPVVLIGASLGGAVALQEAAGDSRVAAVIAAESFSDVRTVARERAPAYFTAPIIERAFALAERQGQFRIDDASPERAAPLITASVLLIHGAADVETRPDHSRRIYRALTGPKRLILVPGAGHNRSLQPEVWPEIDAWIENAVGPEPPL
jgi:pimeloyl-ACP methyl ester carboxylesterase